MKKLSVPVGFCFGPKHLSVRKRTDESRGLGYVQGQNGRDMTSADLHHPAPWVVDDQSVRDRIGLLVATVPIAANAERIAACVTACEGIPTEELRAGILQDLVACCEPTAGGRMRAILDRLKGRRARD